MPLLLTFQCGVSEDLPKAILKEFNIVPVIPPGSWPDIL